MLFIIQNNSSPCYLLYRITPVHVIYYTKITPVDIIYCISAVYIKLLVTLVKVGTKKVDISFLGALMCLKIDEKYIYKNNFYKRN